MNVVVGSICCLGLSACAAVFMQRIHKARKSGRRWCALVFNWKLVLSTVCICVKTINLVQLDLYVCDSCWVIILRV